ncbi:MAG: hypothetical protein JXR26_06580, partial [Balneolaceae bacterium]|nr:hypothetical protein [Balneolaceae bacterium]
NDNGFILDIFKKRIPNFFNDPPGPVNFNNFRFVPSLFNLWQANGQDQQAQKLAETYCRGIQDLHINFTLGKDDPQYIEAKTNCLLFKEKYQEALPYVKKYFIDENGLFLAPLKFQSPMYEEAMQSPAYQKIREQVETELTRQRENVIAYLKREGDWKPEWN